MILALSLFSVAQAQEDPYDPSWYDPSRTYVKVAVVEDGVYQVTGADLTALGLSISSIAPRNLKLYKNGTEIPLWYTGEGNALTPDAKIYFVGERNQGTDEAWAYRNNPEWQSSTFFSLYTDTTFYWLSWDRMAGLRYESTDPDGGSVGVPDVYAFRHVLHTERDGNYHDGAPNDVENPFFTRGEGYYWDPFIHKNTNPISKNYREQLTKLARDENQDDSVFVEIKLNGRTGTRHLATLEVETVVDGNRVFAVFDETDWTGSTFETLRAGVLASQVPTRSNNKIQLRVTSHNDFNAQPNQIYVDWVEYSFMHKLSATSGRLQFSFEDGGARRMHLTDFGNTPVYVFNPTDRRFFELTSSGGEAVFTDRPSGPPTYWAVSPSGISTPAAIALERSSDWASPTNEADYIIVTSRALRASAEIMADYRRSQNGFRVAVVDIQDIYDQFDYGRPTPIAIRRFVYQTQRWRTKPRFLLFWGDALYARRWRPRPAWEVPSYGKASSDGWFAMQYHGPEDWSEVLAIGRLPLRDNASGLTFIQKLETYESTPLDRWQKRMLMLVGGDGAFEQATLQRFVEPWSQRALAAPSGMDTVNFHRTTETALDPTFQDTLRVALREGASWLSYFGHSAATTWEIVTDEPKDFNNATRLPMAISLGCRTGAFAGGSNVQADIPVLAEKLVVGSLNGAIAHWGTSGLGSVPASARMGGILHELVFSDTLRTIGPIFQEVKRRYASELSPSLRDLVQFGLIGDPATRLAIPERADFHLAQEHIRITPTVPDPADGELSIAIRLTNRGLVPADSITVHLIHTAPDGTETTHPKRVAPFRLEKEVVFTVPIDAAFVGANRFRAEIDPENAYREVAENNNAAERNQVIFSRDLLLIAPLDMSAVSSTRPHLRVSFAAQDAPDTPVLFEIDTSPTYDSPALRRFRTTTSGTYAVWSIDEPLDPGRAYFWRARLETSDGLVNWKEATFFVDEGITGNAWVQASSLFERNKVDERLSWNDEEDRWVFNRYPTEVLFSSEGGSGQFKGQFRVDGILYEFLELGFGMLIIDKQTGEVRASGSMPTYANDFEDPESAKAELNALVNTFEEGDYVFVRTRHLGNRNREVEIPEDVKAVFRSLGSTAIDTLTYGHLWLMRTRAGHPEETMEWVEPPGGTNEIVQEAILSFTYGEGQTQSPRIGPAQSWQSFEWEAELANADSRILIDVLDGETQKVLIDSIATAQTIDLSAIDATDHPFLRLQATLTDSSQSSTPQLTQWNVHFTSIAELVLDGSLFTVSADTLQEGESLTARASILNLSDIVADTVVYRLTLTDALNRSNVIAADTLLRVAPNDTASVSFPLTTNGLLGRNQLTLEVEQPNLSELITFNNTAFTGFVVRGDQQAPTLTVTIDGQTLPHDPDPIRDLQSPDIPLLELQPTIEIALVDDNEFKLLSDTSLVTVTLDDERISFSNPDLAFQPATATNNEARILYTPDFSGQDAVHTLAVRAFDVVGNEAEGSPYQVHFRVESAFEIGSIYPYPNPMNRFTQFAFLLKGATSTLIEDFRIRIYTLTGRVVQEFDLVENPSLVEGGQLHTGWNKVYWDGRDADGDLLATGVYLYKVYMTVDGEEIEVNEAPVEKIVVLR